LSRAVKKNDGCGKTVYVGGLYKIGFVHGPQTFNEGSRKVILPGTMEQGFSPLINICRVFVIFLVSLFPMLGGPPCHHSMALPRFADGRDGL
jgi:hypothetical protein